MSDLGWFSDMTWQQVLLFLIPVALVMWLVRRIEKRRDMSQYCQAVPAAKAWLWLQSLYPGTAAKAMLQCDPLLLRAYMEAGRELDAKSVLWLQAAAREFLKADGTDVKCSADDDVRAVLSEYVEENTAEALAALQRVWPVHPAAEPAESVSPEEPADIRPEPNAELSDELKRCEPRQPDAAPILEPAAKDLQPLPIWEDGPSNEAEGK